MKIAKIKWLKTVLVSLIVFSLIVLPGCTSKMDNEENVQGSEEIITLKIAHFMPPQHFSILTLLNLLWKKLKN